MGWDFSYGKLVVEMLWCVESGGTKMATCLLAYSAWKNGHCCDGEVLIEEKEKGKVGEN